MGEGLVKLITCNDLSGRWVDVWRSGTFWVFYQSQKGTTERLSTQPSRSLAEVSESCLTAVQKECGTPPHVHPTSRS